MAKKKGKYLVLAKHYFSKDRFKYSHQYADTIDEAREITLQKKSLPVEIFKLVAKKASDSNNIRAISMYE